MPLRIVKRHGSPFWYIRGTVRGVSVDESTGIANREQAEAFRAKREWAIVAREIGGDRAVATFLEAAVSYMEGGGERRFIKRGTVRGVSVDESTGIANREQAEAFRAKREWAIVAREIGGDRAVATFLEAAVSYAEGGGGRGFIYRGT